jgi:hypothetical protein
MRHFMNRSILFLIGIICFGSVALPTLAQAVTLEDGTWEGDLVTNLSNAVGNTGEWTITDIETVKVNYIGDWIPEPSGAYGQVEQIQENGIASFDFEGDTYSTAWSGVVNFTLHVVRDIFGNWVPSYGENYSGRWTGSIVKNNITYDITVTGRGDETHRGRIVVGGTLFSMEARITPVLELEVDGTLDPGLPPTPPVFDDVYGESASVRSGHQGYGFNPKYEQGLPEPIDMSIHVFDEPPLGVPGLQGQGTKFMLVVAEPQPSFPLPPMGLTVRIPLKEPLPDFEPDWWGDWRFRRSLELKRVDPETGALVRARMWAWGCLDPPCLWKDDFTREELMREGWGYYLMPASGRVVDPYVECPPELVVGAPGYVRCGTTALFYGVAELSTIVGVVAEVIPVPIDIEPGSDSNPINLKKKGVIPVAILGGPSLGSGAEIVDIIDSTTLIFQGAWPKHDLTDPETIADHLEDVNGDGLMDLVIHFVVRNTDLSPGDTIGCLEGLTNAGQSFSGCDSVKCK